MLSLFRLTVKAQILNGTGIIIIKVLVLCLKINIHL